MVIDISSMFAWGRGGILTQNDMSEYSRLFIEMICTQVYTFINID